MENFAFVVCYIASIVVAIFLIRFFNKKRKIKQLTIERQKEALWHGHKEGNSNCHCMACSRI